VVRKVRLSFQHSWDMPLAFVPRICGRGNSGIKRLRIEKLLFDIGRRRSLRDGPDAHLSGERGRVPGVGAASITNTALIHRST
jgi:hypothetical protein